MPTYNYPFSGGVNTIAGYGDRWQIMFSGSWLTDEKWGIIISSTSGNFDVGSINFFHAALTLNYCMTFKNRVYLGAGPQVNFSDNGDPKGWEQQNPGAGDIPYLSSFGGQDAVKAISQLQGRLVIVARRSVQVWSVDADPANFALVQEMDNIGTNAPRSVQNMGDFDVIILDDTGYRSLRTREVTLNAYVDDVGTPIDQLVQVDLAVPGAVAGACSVVEPTTKNLWEYINGKIYVFSRHPGSKIQAWSTYSPTFQVTLSYNSQFNGAGAINITGLTVGQQYNFILGNATSIVCGATTLTASGELVALATTAIVNGPALTNWTGSLQGPSTFTPKFFIIFNGVVYCRTTERYFITYSPASYDGSIMTVQTPWLDHKKPSTNKTSSGIDVAIAGKWIVQASMDPKNQVFETAIAQGNPAVGVMSSDSTYDSQRYEYNAVGTHIAILARTTADRSAVARLAAINIIYELGNVK